MASQGLRLGLASYAAADIARCDPIRVGITTFCYSIRTAIVPFMFIFNTQLLLSPPRAGQPVLRGANGPVRPQT
jgi:TRAP-type uncharacterized transport system fused permease subunit